MDSKDQTRPLNGTRICLIEYDDGNRKALTHLLSNAGAKVADVAQMPTIETLSSDAYDVVILGDVVREGKENLVDKLLSLCQNLKDTKHSSSHLPLLVTSTLNGRAEEDAQKLLAAGASAVFRKPYNTHELLEAVAALTTPTPSITGSRVVLEPRTYEQASRSPD